MRAQHFLLGIAFTAAAAAPPAALAQSSGTVMSGSWRHGWWGRTALGLSVNRTDFRLPCASQPGGCEELSVVGRASFGETSFGLYGKLGSMYSRSYALGADTGYGLSYGAGLSWDFAPRASATLGFDSYDIRLGGGPVRATSLGLQWRY